MKRSVVLTALLLATSGLALGAWWLWSRSESRPPKRIVYAAPPESPDTASFVRLLEDHFPHVRSIPLADLATADLSHDDVLIVGGSYKDDEPKGLSLDAFAIPTVLIGGMGGRVSDDLDLKLGWKYG